MTSSFETDTAVTAAGAAADVVRDLTAARPDPAAPVAVLSGMLSELHDTTLSLADALKSEARASGALLHRVPAARAAQDHDLARDALTKAARRADTAAGLLRAAWTRTREHRGLTRGTPGRGQDPGRALRLARAASARMADLAAAAAAGSEHLSGPRIPAAALLAGHAYVTEVLTSACAGLAAVCGALAGPLGDAYAHTPGPSPVTALTGAAEQLQQAHTRATGACAALSRARDNSRHAQAARLGAA